MCITKWILFDFMIKKQFPVLWINTIILVLSIKKQQPKKVLYVVNVFIEFVHNYIYFLLRN